MKALKIAATILAITGVIFLAVSCSSGSGATLTVKTQTVTVQKGSLAVAVTGTGNLALSRKEDLAFEIAGVVEEVLVKEGESVKEGQELVKLDTSDWDKQLKALEKALVTAQRNLTTEERDLTKAERQVTTKELAVRQAKLNLQSAEDSVKQIADVKKAQDAVDAAKDKLRAVKMALTGDMGGGFQTTNFGYWSDQQAAAEQQLTEAQEALQDVLRGTSLTVSSNVALQVAKAQLQVEQSRMQLEDAQIAVEDAGVAVANARLDKEDAAQAVKDAQTALDEAKSLSPIIKAPFAGFITKVSVKGGDEVKKGTVAMQLADPGRFEANILVTEKDVFSVKLGESASVSLDALSGLSFPAKITAVAPLATTSQGVVNYKVTVELTSLQPSLPGRSTSGQRTSPSTTGAGASGTAPAFQSGTTGASQAPSGTSGFTRSGASANATSVQTLSLKDGLSALVNIVIQEKSDILTVPNRAITRQGLNSTVQVVKGTGTETRIVKTGMSNSSSTEITEGLSEGEQVVFTTTTSATSPTNQFGPPGMGGIRIR